MRPMQLLKWSISLGSLAALLLLAPACKAQADVAPDQFDQPNTEPFEKPKASSPAAELSKANHKASGKQAAVATKAKARKPAASHSAQLLSASDFSQTGGKDAAAMEPVAKAAPRKPKE